MKRSASDTQQHKAASSTPNSNTHAEKPGQATNASATAPAPPPRRTCVQEGLHRGRAPLGYVAEGRARRRGRQPADVDVVLHRKRHAPQRPPLGRRLRLELRAALQQRVQGLQVDEDRGRRGQARVQLAQQRGGGEPAAAGGAAKGVALAQCGQGQVHSVGPGSARAPGRGRGSVALHGRDDRRRPHGQAPPPKHARTPHSNPHFATLAGTRSPNGAGVDDGPD